MKSRHTGSFAPAHSRVAAFSRSTIVAALPLLAAGAALAQAASDSPTQEVVVTAARVEQKLPDTLPSTSVISRKDIESSPATDLPDLLRTFTSFGVAQTGPLGAQTSVFVRGANSNQVLVLIDGAPLSRADFGSAPWELIPLDQIDHVEIVRGNLSSLYGGSAVGGVVQIFTKHGSGASVALGVGTLGTSNGSASIGHRFGDAATPLDLSASISGQTTNGYSAGDPRTNPGVNPDRDGAHQDGATFGVGKTWLPGQRTEFNLMHSDTHSAYDGLTKAIEQDVLNTTLDEFSLQSHHQLLDTLKLDLSAGETLQHFHDPTEADGKFGPNSTYGSGRTRLLGAQLDWRFAPDHSVQVQYEDRSERFGAELDPQRTRVTKSERIGYLGSFLDAVDVQANLRHDHADDYGSADTGLLALGWRITPAWKVVGQVSTAFSAPSFSDLEFAAPGDSLRAEHSRDIELGVHWTGAGWLARATWFSQRQRDLIGFDPVTFDSINIGHASNRGIELAADGDTGYGKLGLDATFQNPRDTDDDTPLAKRARTIVTASYRLPILGWDTGAYLHYDGRRFESDPVTFATVQAKARTTLGLSTQHALSENWSIGAKVDNVANNRTPEVLGYTAPRRTLLVTLRGHWQ
ncbi:TonB-dependent receptor plug domain-containing protein [Scleromatobacter humisilvae]|uniref:TonB-dependent receptor n=1 Tax=Scleromatobacter humisilvae TaxID=2897159 RepID=A0A9X1YMW9_9BURK|nr:TonB-dependent receptor [Scleromatobacter humisilvae]MCK9689123.1 TonB-dependent receptor [Scleromatobacter humisilvae]